MNGKQAALLASGVVLVAVLAGLFVAGAPGGQRLVRLDELRVAHLQQLANALTAFHEQAGRLPGDLAVLVDGQRLSNLPVDPESGSQYGYEIVTMDSYRLCADFAVPGAAGTDRAARGDFWAHQGGRHCFEFSVERGEAPL